MSRAPRTLTCGWCRKPFEQANRRGPIPRYHNASCRQRAYEQRAALRRAIRFVGETGMLKAGWIHVDRLPDR